MKFGRAVFELCEQSRTIAVWFNFYWFDFNNKSNQWSLSLCHQPKPLRELTFHMISHGVTRCHPAEVTFPPLPQPIKTGTMNQTILVLNSSSVLEQKENNFLCRAYGAIKSLSQSNIQEKNQCSCSRQDFTKTESRGPSAIAEPRVKTKIMFMKSNR